MVLYYEILGGLHKDSFRMVLCSGAESAQEGLLSPS